MKGYKGFNKDLKCRDFQFEIGKEYQEEWARACERGFHFCEFPLDVFGYYAPNDSRYCEIDADGDMDKGGDDSKVACTKIKIGAEISLPGLIKAGVNFIFERVNWAEAKESNTGDRSAATNTGYQSAASVEGKESVAMAIGYQSRAKGALGCWLVLSECKKDAMGNWHIADVQSTKIDGESIKADTWYELADGQFMEVID